ncbi:MULTISPECIES: ribulose-phosphate 3-epimerase [Clostridium]|jgi:ribulose-phosphate 3-epimerase|uniref:Ribulose-phosphate 3-epimerase n=3 Tax=Clostridium TaxID=1485 RepID=A0AAV3VYH0_9CLOT|nr:MULTISPECIES: ribulose-phosphate 3-epimerase [Clostridium]ABR32735.1 Ribulose-phosphate 3-epimerase [Clostridium beijerinckii NCIMB 8052]AIU03765.1 ribulose-phosphate 3-epimerase [Clostridium beijerinckii ATCC 35702]ALB48113.1 ribulose-phosphate 3-epimerase [Clostridium beijerinckii NRRL B-598]MBF7807586.1 ribulose-phosphate 3-epimerase [Clostridium beijerinckii]NRT26032.1 ribulose-phosphate 3-epimerase [Clostridium beijerinckii]
MEVKLSPSILGANFLKLEETIVKLKKQGIKELHIDIMDGHFVPNIAFGIDQIKMIKQIACDIELDVHLMVTNPEIFIDALVEAGANTITIHQESSPHIYNLMYIIKSFGIKVGVALNPATPINTLKHISHMVNKILIMTVEPGFGGQSFIEPMMEKINEVSNFIKSENIECELQVDGGINLENIGKVVENGATNIVVGSAIFREEDIDSTIKRFREAIL